MRTKKGAIYIQYTPKDPVPPGDILLEAIQERGITQAELARRMQRPLKLISEIIKAKTAITIETAIQLEQVLGISARYWNSLETGYQDLVTRIENEKKLKEEVDYVEHYNYKELIKVGWIPETQGMLNIAENLLRFFGVTSLKQIAKIQYMPQGLYKLSNARHYSIHAIQAWVRKGVIDAQHIQVDEFNRDLLISSLDEIRKLTLIEDLNVAISKLKIILSKCGIVYVVTKNLTNAPIIGASQWLTPDKALIQMSIKYRWHDVFWFTTFHEIGHVLLHNKSDINIDVERYKEMNSEKEIQADRFASEILIPNESYKKLVKVIKTTGNQEYIVRHFASAIDISPSIVVGRLHHDSVIPVSHLNGLRPRFVWKDS